MLSTVICSHVSLRQSEFPQEPAYGSLKTTKTSDIKSQLSLWTKCTDWITFANLYPMFHLTTQSSSTTMMFKKKRDYRFSRNLMQENTNKGNTITTIRQEMAIETTIIISVSINTNQTLNQQPSLISIKSELSTYFSFFFILIP